MKHIISTESIQRRATRVIYASQKEISEKTSGSEMALARVTKEVYLISADVWITLILPFNFY